MNRYKVWTVDTGERVPAREIVAPTAADAATMWARWFDARDFEISSAPDGVTVQVERSDGLIRADGLIEVYSVTAEIVTEYKSALVGFLPAEVKS